jgi:DNA-binding NtrC family response regulator
MESALMESHTSKTSPPSGRDVLVIEDEARIRDMLARALKSLEFSATFANSAEAGARAIAAKTYDILILDLNLPGMGGIEFLEMVRRHQCDIQVIILTGFGDLEAAKKAIHLDVVEFLTKPCALGTLEVALARAHQRRKAQFVTEVSASPEPAMQFEVPKPAAAPVPAPEPGEIESMDIVEQRHILSVLEKHKGNRAATAAELDISVRKLYYRLREYQKKGLLPER